MLGDKTQQKLSLSPFEWKARHSSAPVAKCHNTYTEQNIEKGIESDSYPKRSGKWCTQKTSTPWCNKTMSMRTMPMQTVTTKFIYIK